MCGDLTSARPACVSGSGYELFHAAILDKSKQGFFLLLLVRIRSTECKWRQETRISLVRLAHKRTAAIAYTTEIFSLTSHTSVFDCGSGRLVHIWPGWRTKRGLFRWFLQAIAPLFTWILRFLRFIEFCASAKTLPNIYSPPVKINKMLNCWRWHLAKNIQFCV